MQETTPSPEEAAMNKALEVLGEFYDSVQILCTRVNPDDKETQFSYRGKGNLFTRKESCRHFIARDDYYNQLDWKKDHSKEDEES